MTIDLRALFDDVVRLKIGLWNAVDTRLRIDHELPPTWYEPMDVVDRMGMRRINDIAMALMITVGSASNLVDRIANAGLLQRRPHPTDRRSSHIALTMVGRTHLDAARATVDDELSRLLGDAVHPEALQRFAVTAHRLRTAVQPQQRPRRT
jgi:DNA-binding MarR family transcriptional regulator